MDYLAAIDKRVSRRHFTKDPVLPMQITALQHAIDESNGSGGLDMKMIVGRGEPFSAKNSFGMFSGVQNYIILAGPENDKNCEEKLGYFGESIVLLAVSLGLATCWVGKTYNRELAAENVEPGEIMKCCIAFGNVKPGLSPKELAVSRGLKRNIREVKDRLYVEETPPNWVVAGMRSVVKAPSARNRQSTMFIYASDRVSAKIDMKNETDPYDLGIAKLHFEIGAGIGKGSWDFGNGATYERHETADQHKGY